MTHSLSKKALNTFKWSYEGCPTVIDGYKPKQCKLLLFFLKREDLTFIRNGMVLKVRTNLAVRGMSATMVLHAGLVFFSNRGLPGIQG